MHRTSAHVQRSEASVAFAVLDDIVDYLKSKNVNVVPEGSESDYVLDLTVDRPISKWLKVELEVRNNDGTVLSHEEADSGTWSITGANAVEDTDKKIKRLIDRRIGADNGLPVRQVAKDVS